MWSDLVQQVAIARQSGLNVAIAPYVRFEIASQDWWSSAAKDTGWWDGFFDQYGTFLRNAADFAAVNNISALILGDTVLSPAYPGGTLADGTPSNLPEDVDVRWQNVITEARARYSGQMLLQVDFSGGTPVPALPVSLFDAVYLNWSAPLTTAAEPIESDLE
ncbi:hypothetical protein EG834_17030, partial [bacterium]|nr:hypothetical protein [bacterium]